MENRRADWLIPLLLALGAGAALWYYWVQANRPDAEPVAQPEPPAAAPAAAAGPAHPVPEEEPAATEEQQLVPLPPLESSDEYFKLALNDLFGSDLDELLVESRMIERIVATVDNLPRDRVSERIRPLGRIGGAFIVEEQGDDGEFSIGGENYARYDVLVRLLDGADLDAAAETYRRFYPLFQNAYVDLGYPDGYFNDRLVEVIDHLLATPDIADRLALVRPNVLYEFADPQLESLSGGQKLLLRMGGAHRARIKERLREFRDIVTEF